MAASKKTSGAKKKPVQKNTSNKSGTQKKKTNTSSTAKTKQAKSEAQLASERQKWAIGLMAGALLFICVTLIEGESLWKGIHSGLFAFFGTSAYVLPVLLIYVAIVFAKNKPFGSIASNLILVGSFILLLSSAIHIFSNPSDYLRAENLWLQITSAFWAMDDLPNSGFFGALIGGLLSKMAGKIGAAIINIVSLVVILMFLTGTTLTTIYAFIVNSLSKMRNSGADAINKGIESYQEYEDNEIVQTKPFEGKSPIIQLETTNNKKKNPSYTPPWEIPIENYNSPNDKKEKTYKGKPDFTPPSNTVSLTEEGIKINENGEVIEENIDIISQTQKNADIELPPVTKPKNIELDGRAALANEIERRNKKNGILNYKYPTLDCLNPPVKNNNENYTDELQINARNLIETLRSFKVNAKITAISRGPSVTRYELLPDVGVRINKITNLADDIALRLAAPGIRIEAPIPGKAAIGIEIPNKIRSMVTMRELVNTAEFKNAKSKLNVVLGKDITGNIICADIEKMPHLLIAGTTGSGKSVCINAMIVSLLYNASPEEVKLLLIDPKMVEFRIYNGIAHLAVPVVSDPKKASGALSWAVSEMEKRYQIFSERNVRDIKDYNKLSAHDDTIEKMPHIVIFIDELADLMMVAPNEVEDSICRLAQKARAAGMHLVVATQRPSVDVITGLIKANIPSRIALYVSSSVDSRTILDESGAEKLLGNGDLLFKPVGAHHMTRIQGCFVSSKEVKNVVDFIKEQAQTSYDEDIINEIERQAASVGLNGKSSSGSMSDIDGEDGDVLFPKAVELVLNAGMASTTFLQRRLKVGYSRGARIMDELEEKGIVSPADGSKPREVLITKQQWFEMCALGDKPASSEEEDY